MHKNVKPSRALHSDETIEFLEDFVQECALPVYPTPDTDRMVIESLEGLTGRWGLLKSHF